MLFFIRHRCNDHILDLPNHNHIFQSTIVCWRPNLFRPSSIDEFPFLTAAPTLAECSTAVSVPFGAAWKPPRAFGLPCLFNSVHNAIAIAARVRNPRPIFSWAFDLVGISLLHKFHLASLSPPAINFMRKSDPDLPCRAQLREIVYQTLVSVPCPLLDDVVWVNDKTNKAMLI